VRRDYIGRVATAEPIPAPVEGGESIVLEAHRGTHRIAVTVHYAAVRELRELLSGPEAVASGLLLGRWSGEAVVLEHTTAAPSDADAIGIFRVQPGGWTALNPADRKKLRAVGLERGVVLVVRTLAQRPWSATLFAAEPDSAGTEAPLAELPWDEYLLRNGWLLDLAPPAPPQPRPARAVKPRRWGRWLVGTILLLLAGAAGAAAYRWPPALWNPQPAAEATADLLPAPATAPGLALRVVRQAQDLEVSWDRGSDLVRQANAATLTIRSGAATRVIEMQPDQLREGRVVFRPLAGVDTDVRLEVLDSGGKAEAESVQVLGFDTAPAVTLPALPAREAPQSPSPAGLDRKTAPQVNADREDAAPRAAVRKPGALAPPVPVRNGALPLRRATPELTSDVIRELRAAKGKVTVSVLVSIDNAGKVEDAKVVASSGESSPSGPYIRLASLGAARQWRFRPATENGRSVPSQMTLLFTF
jgi:Gram-negative bacterial TonB protein C-terminal